MKSRFDQGQAQCQGCIELRLSSSPQKGYKSIRESGIGSVRLAWRRGGNVREIARERIEILFNQAQRTFPSDPNLAKRYLDLARKVGMKAGVRLTREQKLRICKGCGGFLVPGVNCRVRTRSESGTTVLITCLDCGTKKRYPTVRERLSKKSG